MLGGLRDEAFQGGELGHGGPAMGRIDELEDRRVGIQPQPKCSSDPDEA